MTVRQILERLRALGDPRARAAWQGGELDAARGFGAPASAVRTLARSLGHDHSLALALWETGVADARLLATLVEDVDHASDEQLDRWVVGADQPELADRVAQVAMRSIFARMKVADWKDHTRAHVRRAAYLLLGDLATRDRGMTDADFVPHVDAIQTLIHREVPPVRAAMHRALVRIGRRNPLLQMRAASALERIGAVEGSSPRRRSAEGARMRVRGNAAEWARQRTG